MLITPSFKKSLIVEQFQGNYLKNTITSVLQHKWLANVNESLKELRENVNWDCLGPCKCYECKCVG